MYPLQAKPSKKQSRMGALGLNGKMCGAEEKIKFRPINAISTT